jgi:hypothetical protein
MRVDWKLIIFEILLEILLEFAPGSLDTLATIAEYLVETSREASRATLVMFTQTANIAQHGNLSLYTTPSIY